MRPMELERPNIADIRWIVRSDMPAVLSIEQAGFSSPWTEEDFCSILRRLNCFGMVAEINEQVVGYMVCSIDKSSVEILRLAVDPPRCRRGIASQMVAHLKTTKSAQKNPLLVAVVREGSVGTHLFLKSLGFLATEVLRGHQENGEDEYRFEFNLQSS